MAQSRLAVNAYFQKALTKALDQFHSHLEIYPSNDSPQQQWDAIKSLVRDIAQKIGRRKHGAHKRMLTRLQSKRNKLLRQFKLSQILPLRLATIEKQIGIIEQEVTETHALRAGTQWQENGEKSAGYLKRIIEQRSVRRNIPSLRHPTTNQLCTSNSELQSATIEFYNNLYTPSPINSIAVSTLAATISSEHQIPLEKQHTLIKPFTFTDIESQANRSPKKSSPGKDGIPYEILHLLLQHPPTARLALSIFNDALTNRIFPDSWLHTCMCLLPKKGDLSDLRNWRPISLINTDAKVFTRLLKNRLMDQLSSCISPHQLGFMPNRFIANHGLTLHLTKIIAAHQHSSSIALLLDQEKAYDRVHPDYLSSIMQKFGIPTQIINCIHSLFFSTNIAINVNGHITNTPVSQLRGLRQGDPLSPLLFNIAFDPFLRLIAQDPDFKGFQFQEEAPEHVPPTDPLDDFASAFEQLYVSPLSPTSIEDLTRQFTALLPFQDQDLDEPPPSFSSTHTNPLAAKILAYADDTLVFLSNHNDFYRLQNAINIYSSASNAHLNYHKTEATSLSGAPIPYWQSFLPQHNITAWHDRRSPSPITYLGYPIFSSITQRSIAFQHITTNITQACNMHSQHQLSIRGRATVLNTLIYSKLWNILRLFPFTKVQLQQIISIGSSFINRNIFPRISIATLQLPRSKGGLGILNPVTQQHALQWRWISPVLQSDTLNNSSNCLSFLRYTLQWFFHSNVFPSYRYYLLFPICRQIQFFFFRFSNQSLPLNILNTFIHTVDSLPKGLEDCHIDPFTYLSLPFITAIKPAVMAPPSGVLSPGLSVEKALFLHPGFRKLVCSDVFTFDYTTLQLRLRSAPFNNVKHPTLAKAAVFLIQSNQLLLHSFFNYNCQPAPRHQPPPNLTLQQRIDLSALVSQIIQPIIRPNCNLSSTNHYKSLLPLPTVNIPTSLSPTQWLSFWSLKIPLPSRTIWFRLLHKKISCKQTLHKIIPRQHPSPNCTICLNNQQITEESLEHMLFLCPAKHSVWLDILSFYINNSIKHVPNDIIHILRTVSNFTNSSTFRDLSLPYASLSFEQIFACTLQGIWQSHWYFIFNATPFSPSATISKIHSIIHKLYSQTNYLDSSDSS